MKRKVPLEAASLGVRFEPESLGMSSTHPYLAKSIKSAKTQEAKRGVCAPDLSQFRKSTATRGSSIFARRRPEQDPRLGP